jgi:hypothetical protein
VDTWGWGSTDRLLSADLAACVKQNVAFFFFKGFVKVVASMDCGDL